MSDWTVSSAAAFWSRTAASSASRCLELSPGAGELRLLLLDRVAVRGHLLDREPGAVAQRAHAADDRGVLLLDPAQVLIARDEVVEAVGFEHHREQVGAAGAVDADQPLAQHVERAPELLLELLEVILGAVEAGLSAAQLADHDRLAVAQHRDLAGELVDLAVVVGELAREDPLLVLLLVELGLALLELGLQVLGAGGATEAEQGDQPREQGRSADEKSRAPCVRVRVVADWHRLCE